ncbi:hypothetical protein ACROYT_G037902 [Oculina patagonica]
MDRHFVLASLKSHVTKISKIFGDFVPRDPAFARVFSRRAAILKTRRREGPGDKVASASGPERQANRARQSHNTKRTVHDQGRGRLGTRQPCCGILRVVRRAVLLCLLKKIIFQSCIYQCNFCWHKQ